MKFFFSFFFKLDPNHKHKCITKLKYIFVCYLLFIYVLFIYYLNLKRSAELALFHVKLKKKKKIKAQIPESQIAEQAISLRSSLPLGCLEQFHGDEVQR